ncbi:MAG: GDSL-type esterase/lipase family protein [Bacteroidota bacterium]
MQGLQKYVFGVLAVVASFILYLPSAGCKKAPPPKYIPPSDTAINGGGTTTDTLRRLLALGDSYTIGQSVPENDRFPNLTIDWLKMRGAKMQYPAQIIAQTGWTTANLLNGISNANPAPVGPYDLVTLLIGVNNQYQHRDTAEYRSEFTNCLLRAIALSGNRINRVFVLSIPDWGATPYGQSANPAQVAIEIDRFNVINKQVCLQMGVSYTDITPATRNVSSDPTLVAGDGLHYSGKEHAIWAAMVGEKMLPLVR